MINRYCKIFLSFLFLTFCASTHGQKLDHGFTVGLSFSFGTTVNRIGIHGAFYSTLEFAQVNLGSSLYYNFQSYGLKGKTIELQSGAGLQFGFGSTDTLRNNFIGLMENNTFHDLSAGLAYLYYWDRQGTSQSTGIIGLNAYNWTISTENDLFGNFIHQNDRFRTGAFLVEYQYLNTKIGIEAVLWTHDYSDCTRIQQQGETDWARFGYYEDKNVKNRAHSLGLLSFQLKQWLPCNQQAELNIGVNSEKVRNAIQNEFIHDQPFFPDALIKRKPAHIPMMTTSAEQYLYLPNQLIKPASFYFNIGLNTLSFY